MRRHDLTTDWLKPFIRDSSWRDLRTLALSWGSWRLGRGSWHRVSVQDFMATHGISERCARWMRATALGGIAGTLRMTMWEFFHRIGTNVIEILRGDQGPLFWNAQPPNTRGGFIARWTDALAALDVEVRPQTEVLALTRAGGTVQIQTSDGVPAFDAALLAIPPPAVARLLERSQPSLRDGFGSLDALRPLFRDSVYEHLGITWFFDRPLPSDLPLGGHNVLAGWHPILVQHDQYRVHLASPAVTAVVGSIALDTDFRHHRLGTRAVDHSHEQLATILWDDERERDPTLPQPIDVEIMGLSNATQIVGHGPLPIRMKADPVFLASNLHGQAPYFTASLESAIQAGALAAQALDPTVERLPMGRPARLPWATPTSEGEPTLTTEALCAESS